MTFDLYDTARAEWRTFHVVPTDGLFLTRCGGMANELHQFASKWHAKCACGAITRAEHPQPSAS